MIKRPCVMISFREGAQGSGPYNSNMRIANSRLSEKYEFINLMIPKGTLGILNYKLVRKLMKDIGEARPDMVHFTGLQLEGFYVSLACRLLSVRSLCVVRGSSLEANDIGLLKKSILFLLETLTLCFSTAFYCNSRFVSSWRRFTIFRRKSFGWIYNLPPIEGDCSKSDARLFLKNKLALSDDSIVVVYTGRVTVDKGSDVTLDLVSRGVFRDNVHLLILGSGPGLQDILDKSIEAGCYGNIHSINYVSDVSGYLRGSDIFISCSKHETLGNSIIEASLNSLPVVAKKTGGIPEIVKDGETGILVDDDSVDGYEEALRALVKSCELRSRMGAGGRERVLIKFNREGICSSIDNVYEALVSNDGR